MSFVPAKNKAEAVARISSLTSSGPETLGPGSTERKSVLVNLARGLGVPFHESETKHELGASIARSIGAPWTQGCFSTGQTITLTGLNVLLGAATSLLARDNEPGGTDWISPYEEASLISDVVVSVTPDQMDGRTCITEMRHAQSTNWRQTEWPGWYFEFIALPALVNYLGGGPQQIGSTKFDYCREYVWDLKTHSRFGSVGPSRPAHDCILNDMGAMQTAINRSGMGLVVLTGDPRFDDPGFTEWHMGLRGRTGVPRRKLKSSFTPKRLDLFFLSDLDALNRSVDDQRLSVYRQGRQQSGAERNLKYKLHLERSKGTDIHLLEHRFDGGDRTSQASLFG